MLSALADPAGDRCSKIGTTATYPFRLVNLLSAQSPSGTNGTDNTSANNQAVVTFNNVDYRAGQTGN